ncbi:putative phosphate repressible phosphate permease [Trypanosoma vivax]|nr:putative phosphate repressible phosphate permease [Trypanosoma vivax]
MYFLPVIVGITFFLESFFVLYKGAKARLHWSAGKAAWVSAIVGCCASIVTTALLPFLSRRVRWLWERRQRDGMSAAEAPGCVKESPEPVPETLVREPAMCPMTSPPPESGADGGAGAGAGAGAEHGAAADAPGGGCLGTKSISAYMVDEGKHSTEMYDSRVEYVFRYLQVFTAVCASFAHGANDVSNAVGPFAAIYSIYENKAVMARNDMPIWILCLGGAGIVCGLATLGVRIMRLLGERITRITPSRGFAAELSAALVVSLASAYGIPVSSTHCITGAVVAIRILDNGFCSVPWLLVGKMYAGWMFTLVITGLISAALFAQGVYAPAVSSG